MEIALRAGRLRFQATSRSNFPEQPQGLFPVIGDPTVQNGLLDLLLQLPYNPAGWQAKHLHDFVAGNRWLEVADMVLLLDFRHFLLYEVEVSEKPVHLFRVFR